MLTVTVRPVTDCRSEAQRPAILDVNENLPSLAPQDEHKTTEGQASPLTALE